MVMRVRISLIPSSSLTDHGPTDIISYNSSKSALPIGKRANAAAARSMKESMKELIDEAQEEDFPGANEENGMEEEEDDFDEGGREWEAAQIKRGEGRRVVLNDEVEGKKVYRAKPSLSFSTSSS